ncbi:hypothetical protein POM88_019873 [Heracleum sosnowskyi]|uniref:Uncharacterized protein n=1 Tax=Heracleum sosnowskyi TaxID=360622 RepID=A0AAD8ICZ8_9APIA|nr:hypothetical protein POM88_019873 [Heracleum sosnowskyi]
MFEKVYAHIVEPINGREAWAKTAYTQPLPPNEQRHEFSPGASQPTIEVNDSQGGIFGPPPGKRTTAACGVAPKAWQKKKQTVTTRTEILRARSVREKKATQRYHD